MLKYYCNALMADSQDLTCEFYSSINWICLQVETHIANHKVSSQIGYVLVERPQDYEVDLDDLPAMFVELANFCKETDCRKVLIAGENVKVNLGVMDIFKLGSQLAKLHLQIAMVESHDASNDDVDFLQNVTLNRGGRIRFFDTQGDAKDWLGVS